MHHGNGRFKSLRKWNDITRVLQFSAKEFDHQTNPPLLTCTKHVISLSSNQEFVAYCTARLSFKALGFEIVVFIPLRHNLVFPANKFTILHSGMENYRQSFYNEFKVFSCAVGCRNLNQCIFNVLSNVTSLASWKGAWNHKLISVLPQYYSNILLVPLTFKMEWCI